MTFISILLYGCETWILAKALIERLDIFSRTCNCVMLCIEQSRDHVTNKSLYQLTGQVKLCGTIYERQLKFTVYKTHMPICLQGLHIPIKFCPIFYVPSEKTLEANEIRKMTSNKSL